MMALMLDPIKVRHTKRLFCTTADGHSFFGCGNTGLDTPELPA